MIEPTEAPCALTVIIPFYNETAFISMAVWSCLGQGISGLDVIIVNDNPAEFGPDYFDGLGFPETVRVLHHMANAGLSAARNTGIAAARGAIIGFLDADDYYVSGGLAAHLDFAQRSGADMIHAQTYITRVGSPQLSVLPRDRRLFAEQKVRKGLRDCENAQFITSSWSSLYRADFLVRARLTFDEAQVKFEDRLFVLSAVTAAGSIAQLGEPVRVWRRRAGSISTSRPDSAVHVLQVQLLEKCLAVMSAWSDRTNAPPRFLKREIYNTIARLIWDIDIFPAIVAADDPVYADLGGRLQRLSDYGALGGSIFDDPLVKVIDRVGAKSRKGFITRADFFEIQRAVREADFTAANALLLQRRATRRNSSGARPKGRKLILHLGMHKTGSTAVQRWLSDNVNALADLGILFPATGLPTDPEFSTRDEGLPGHQLLLSSLADDTAEETWDRLDREIAVSGCQTVFLSCENFLMPFREDRAEVMPQLIDLLARFDDIHPFAFVRRPDVALDRLYREVVAIGSRAGSRTIEEFQVDYQSILTDLPELFRPFEELAGRRVRLLDYDAQGRDPIAAIADALGLPELLKVKSEAPMRQVYRTLDRETVTAARTINALLTSQDRRHAALRDFFRTAPRSTQPEDLFLSPHDRRAVLSEFQEKSAIWAAERGYAPDFSDLVHGLVDTTWSPAMGLSPAMNEAMLQACLRSETDTPSTVLPKIGRGVPDRAPSYSITIRPKPWLIRLLRRFGRGV